MMILSSYCRATAGKRIVPYSFAWNNVGFQFSYFWHKRSTEASKELPLSELFTVFDDILLCRIKTNWMLCSCKIN
jgi:hypothetical protein